MKARESRQAVIVQAHMRGSGDWTEVIIRNISPHGMLIYAASPPRPGTYVEIRKSSLTLVGRTVWVKGKAFGIELIERLNFNALLKAANDAHAAAQSGAPAPLEAAHIRPPAARDRSGTERAITGRIVRVAAFGSLAVAIAFATAAILVF